MIAQLGVILYMFLVGLDLNGDLLRKRGHATVAVSHASIVLPFLLGALLAVGLYPRLSSANVPFTSFALFLGVAMAVTAFPVLARILTDRRMSRTELGVMALTCAAIDDVTAWCLLAFVVGVVFVYQVMASDIANRLGEYAKARDSLIAAAKLRKQAATAENRFFLAMSHQRLGDLAAARASFDEALAAVKIQTTLTDRQREQLAAFRAEAETLLNAR